MHRNVPKKCWLYNTCKPQNLIFHSTGQYVMKIYWDCTLRPWYVEWCPRTESTSAFRSSPPSLVISCFSPLALISALSPGVLGFKVLIPSKRGRSCVLFQSQEEECEAVAQWCHLAARQGGGTQRWQHQWVIPHVSPLPFYSSDVLLTPNINQTVHLVHHFMSVPFCRRIGWVTVVSFLVFLSCCLSHACEADGEMLS